MKRTVSFCVATAFSVGFAATSVAPASADYEYPSTISNLGTYTSSSNGVTYTFRNQAFVKEINAGFNNDQARTRTWTTPSSPYLGYLGAEARLYSEGGLLCKTTGMIYDVNLYTGSSPGYVNVIARRLSSCPAGYYYSYGKSARVSNAGWQYFYTFKTDSLYMYN